MNATKPNNANEALKQALRYLLGDGVRKNEAKGRAFLVQAAEAGDPTAMYHASTMLAQGQGGPFDRVTAFRYVERAAELGNLDAIYTLGYYYMTGGMENVGYSNEVLAQKKVGKDEDRGLALWKAAAAQGHGLAAYRIGEYYEDLATDNAKLLSIAIEWYERSLELDEPNGLVRLGDFHMLGKGVPKDRERSRSMYQRAADSDDYCAQKAGKQRLEDFEELETILRENC